MNRIYRVESLLDTDFYKPTTQQFVFHRHPDVQVKFALKNRTASVKLENWIPEAELREELDHARSLQFQKGEIEYLRGIEAAGKKIFKDDYLAFLEKFRLPAYHLKKTGHSFKLEFEGSWPEATYWETIALSTINELYYLNILKQKPRARLLRELIVETGQNRLAEKIKILKKYPGIVMVEFGTRRRFGRLWQDYVVKTLKDELYPKQLLGTSNIYLARKYGLTPLGTMAHELFMGYSGIMHGNNDEIRASHNQVLRDWEEEYAPALLIALTDTYGTKFFFEDMTKEQAERWDGLRQDSGDPLSFGSVEFYRKHGIDPKPKKSFFSDGLEVDSMVKLYKKFHKDTTARFGPGTHFTNDLGFKALSLVVKLVESNGYGTVKLSDNLSKATGKPEDIEKFKQIFGYTGSHYEECKY